MRRVSLILITLVALVLTACAGAGGNPAQPTAVPGSQANKPPTFTGEPILIGVSGPKTGNSAQYGKDWVEGFDLALDEINGKGGIKGRKLEYVFEDTQSDPKQSVVIAQKFVDDPRIVIELGDFSSGASMAASPIYQRGGLVQMGFTNSNPDMTKAGGTTSDFIWSNSRSQTDDAPDLAEFTVKDLNKKKLAVLHYNTDWGKITAQYYVARAKELGAEIVLQESFLDTEKEFRTILTKARDSKPDALILLCYYNEAALIQQQKAQLGFEVPSIGIGSIYSPEFLKLGGKAVEGVYTTSPFHPDDPNPLTQAFVKGYQAKYGKEASYFSAQAYDTIKLLAAVMEQSGTERKQIRDGLAKVKDVPSIIYGKINFNADRRVEKPISRRIQVKDGKFVLWTGK